MKTIVAFALVCALLPSVALSYSWSNCGTRNDRLQTQTLSFSANPGLEAGATATIHTTGATDLHVPLITGAWQVRIYELGFAHPIYTTFGNLADALTFTDAKNTTYSFTVSFKLPAAKNASTSTFTASLISTDQQHATYNCLEVNYKYSSVAEVAPVRVTDGPHFWSCGKAGDKVKVSKVAFSPANPKAGDHITITAEGTSSEEISGGQLKYVAGLDGIPLIHKTEPLCKLLKEAHINCPVKAGPLSVSLGFNLPGFVPPGNYSATGHAYDSNGNELLCMTGFFVMS